MPLDELPFRNGNEPLPFHAAFFPTDGFIPAFARCCFCIAANLLVFTSPTVFPLLPRIIPNLHPCQGVRVADDLRSGDIQKVPRSGGLGVLVGKIVIVKTIVLV